MNEEEKKMAVKPFDLYSTIEGGSYPVFLSRPADHWSETGELFWADGFDLKQAEDLSHWQVWSTAPIEQEAEPDDDDYDWSAEWEPKDHVGTLLLFSETDASDATREILIWAVRAIQSARQAGYEAGSAVMHRSIRNILLAETSGDRTAIVEAGWQIGNGL